MLKLLVVIIALVVNLTIQWYAHTSSKIPESGTFLGLHYDSILASSSIFALKFVWLIILINIGTAYASKQGVEAFGSFFPFILIWIAAIPIAALIYNAVVVKEPINFIHIAGILLIFSGAILISANKEILEFFK